MQSGFNTNVHHRGVLFHVQTEDSGRKHPHVITHLYHGGTILSSEKRDYREQLGSGDVAGVVKALMEEQHTRMLASLQGGEFNALIEERLGDVFGDRSDTTGSTTPSAVSEAAAARPGAAESRGRAFGERIVSEKPLDEVVMEYLVDKARKRRRPSK